MKKTLDKYTAYVITRNGKYIYGDSFNDWTDDLTHPELYYSRKDDIEFTIAEYWDKWDNKNKKNIPGRLRGAKVAKVEIIKTIEIKLIS